MIESQAWQATHVERELGLTETVFFGLEPGGLFECLDVPVEEPTARVLVCPSLDGDFTLRYRWPVLAARSLAARGVLVGRFHYRGTGHSGDDPETMTYDGLVADARAALERLLRHDGAGPLALLGIGWGSMVAASLAGSFHDASLALWEPLADPARYYADAVKASMIRRTIQRAREPVSADALLEDLVATGSMDVVGYELHRSLYESARGRTLTDELGSEPRRILVIRPEGRDALRTDHASLASDWRRRGLDVDVVSVGEATPIWFHRDKFPVAAAGEVAGYVHAWLLGGDS